MKKTILVTAIGSVAGEYVITTLQELGHRVIGCDIYDPRMLAYADLPDKFFQVKRVSDEKGYIEQVESICMSEGVDYIFPLTDVEVDAYDRNRDRFERGGITICISSHETISVLRNKYTLARTVSDSCPFTRAIPTCLLSTFLKEPQEWEGNANGFIAKPADGRSSQGLERFMDREEVEFFAQKRGTGNYIIQPMLPGERVVVDVVRDSKRDMVVAVAREELLYTTNGWNNWVREFRVSGR